MTGVMLSVDYVTNLGVTYPTRVPTWQNTITGATTPGTSSGVKPPNFRRRYRMLQEVATGREHKIIIPDTSLGSWTAANGTAVAAAVLADGSTVSCRWAGRIGERALFRP